MIINAGIERIVTLEYYDDDFAMTLFKTAGTRYDLFSKPDKIKKIL